MKYAALALLLVFSTPLFAEKKPLTLDALYDPKTMVRFSGAVQRGFDWVDDTTFAWPRTDADGTLVEWRLFDLATGKERAYFDGGRMQHALEQTGLSADAAKDASRASNLNFDAKKARVLISAGDDLYVYSFGKNEAVRLTSTAGPEEEATFSPDGQRVAFVRGNNLFVTDLAGRERQLTTDGSDKLLNGKLDYVYQEEIFGRGIFKAYWWSPDSSRLAFLRLDERDVPEYTIVDDVDYHPNVKVFPYPKPGDPNPRVQLKIAPAVGGPIVTVDGERYSAGEHLIVDVTWAPDGTLTYQVQNREQTWLDLAAATPSGSSKTLIHETTPAWVDPLAPPTWLADGTFLWQSERSGFRHLYHYQPDGKLLGQVTKGEWEVRELHGADASFVYFSGTEHGPLGRDVYRIKLDGSGLQRLSTTEGTHTATFSPRFGYFIDKWSDVNTPDQVRVYRNDGDLMRVLDANPVPALAEYELPRPEFLQVKTRDGFPMEAMLIRPTNFDPAKKYPVYQSLYGGPHAQRVNNRWGGQGIQSTIFLQFLAQQGVVIWVVDNRTASGKGAQSAWPAWKNLGELELRDYEDAIAWVKKQPYVDGDRVALFGWSYGGFMVSYALTHSTSFSAGIAGAPVTDWRSYDSVYTERLMLMPQNNPEGYRKASPRFAAKDLHGHLLILHGTTDDNVHPQNTIQFSRELQQAGKTFELMMYPRTRHGVLDKKAVYHLQKTVMEFLERRLLK